MYRAHVLVCGGTGCTSSDSPKIIEALEKEIAAKGLQEEVQVVRTGCFGLCALGPIMIVYPEGCFYSEVKVEDVPEIVEEHLLKGRIVKRLLYSETVKAAEGNIVFEVPTVIPFAAGGDGTLIAPENQYLQIKNKSIFDIHVTNMKVAQEEPWNIVDDASNSQETNAIDFQIGPDADMKKASNASQEDGINLANNANWDMGYLGSGNETLQLSASGHIADVTEDLSAEGGSKVATITWTVAAGQHHV